METEALQKYLDNVGLSQLWSLIIAQIYTPLGNKLANIDSGAQVNVIEGVQVNGVDLEVSGKKVNVIVPQGALASLDKVGKEQLDTALSTLITKLQSATTLSGYGITDAYTKTEVDSKLSGKASNANSLSGYGIEDAYTKTQVDTELAKKAPKATTVAGYGISDAYTKTETNTQIDNKVKAAVAGVYKIKGSIAFASLPTSGMTGGDVYNITDAFTSTSAFAEGAGKSYPAGTNVVYVADSGKWDCMSGTYDFSAYLKTTDIRNLTEEEIAAICVMPTA